ncbi:hypothetical protein B10628_20100 [Campylobacter jejuni]|nr:hypothetical protein B10628_20100 [Campylobacter jejuni]
MSKGFKGSFKGHLIGTLTSLISVLIKISLEAQALKKTKGIINRKNYSFYHSLFAPKILNNSL